MAAVPIVLGITHNPFHYRNISAPRETWRPDTVQRVEHGERLRQKLRAARPDVLVMVANDHLHQFFMNLMPAFTIAKMERFDGIFYNETREFELPRCTIPGDPELAGQILEGMLAKGVDLAYSNELKVDHAVVVPLMFVRPEMDLPIVPVFGNVIAPPLPPARRFYEVGRALRDVLEELPTKKRIAVVVTGNLSLEVGGPLQFEPRPMDEAFDDKALDWIRRGDAEAAIRECTFDRLTAAGNTTYGFLMYILAMGIVRGAPATLAEGLKRAGSTHPFFAWEKLT